MRLTRTQIELEMKSTLCYPSHDLSHVFVWPMQQRKYKKTPGVLDVHFGWLNCPTLCPLVPWILATTPLLLGCDGSVKPFSLQLTGINSIQHPADLQHPFPNAVLDSICNIQSYLRHATRVRFDAGEDVFAARFFEHFCDGGPNRAHFWATTAGSL